MAMKSSDKKETKPKPKHRKGLWSPDEDQCLRDYVLKHGHGCWSSVPINAGLQRNGKSCRLRWINYLRPGLKRGMFTLEEEQTILTLHNSLGNKWSQIALHLPGRTDNEIKNYWHSYLKKRVAKAEPAASSSPKREVEESTPLPPLVPKTPLDEEKLVHESSLPLPVPPQPACVRTLDSPLEQARATLPRIMFAEWLSQDLANDQHQNPTVDFGSECISSDINVGEVDAFGFMQHQHHPQMGVMSSSVSDGLSGVTFGNEYCNLHYNDINSCSVGSRTLGSDPYIAQPQQQQLGFDHVEDECGLIFEYFNGDDICSHLNGGSDVMYL
ncbi:hypothetical protein MLD38_033547 [Melastoma candidum]|uniref:Uncharacterized protein n=1 Tax=Melastoma candidum TaxID=119954 RepID=A0ACB9M783_9MYRT|nr:hypothetical protein MLD38_033547 [Melastoma candidum]